MKKNITIQLLADCPQHIPALAELWYNEIGKQWIPDASVAKAEETYEEHLNRSELPLTYVVTQGNEPIAMCSLRDNDGIRDDLTPWLGSLIVHPDYRRQGLGEMLINIVIERAKKLGHKKLYLFALDPALPAWYEKLGFKVLGMDKLYDHPVTAMETRIA